jgi:hypothetical protein
MSQFTLRLCTPNDFQRWNDFVSHSNNGTIFHRLDFLSYHGDRFSSSMHHLLLFKGNELFGVLPLGIFVENEVTVARTPFGASYGGFVFNHILPYHSAHDIVILMLDYLSAHAVQEIFITPSIELYHKNYCETFLFCLLENGFKPITFDITSIVPLHVDDIEHSVFTSRIRNMARKAEKAGVITIPQAPLLDFWCLMEKTFEKHGTCPTHTRAELEQLIKLFPKAITIDVAYFNNIPVAGVCYFTINDRINMSFYLCTDPAFQHLQALSLLICKGIISSKKNGFQFFDFGTSTVNMIARENIFMYKESFGAIGRFRTTFHRKFP